MLIKILKPGLLTLSFILSTHAAENSRDRLLVYSPEYRKSTLIASVTIPSKKNPFELRGEKEMSVVEAKKIIFSHYPELESQNYEFLIKGHWVKTNTKLTKSLIGDSGDILFIKYPQPNSTQASSSSTTTNSTTANLLSTPSIPVNEKNTADKNTSTLSTHATEDSRVRLPVYSANYTKLPLIASVAFSEKMKIGDFELRGEKPMSVSNAKTILFDHFPDLKLLKFQLFHNGNLLGNERNLTSSLMGSENRLTFWEYSEPAQN